MAGCRHGRFAIHPCASAARARSWVTASVLAAGLALSGCGQGAAASAGPRRSWRRRTLRQHRQADRGAQRPGDEHRRQPGPDPHSYEPTAADARASRRRSSRSSTGSAMTRGPQPARRQPPAAACWTSGALLGLQDGATPIAGIPRRRRGWSTRSPPTSPAWTPGAAYYDRGGRAVRDRAWPVPRRLIAAIRRRYAGVPVGASESIFALLARRSDCACSRPPAS